MVVKEKGKVGKEGGVGDEKGVGKKGEVRKEEGTLGKEREEVIKEKIGVRKGWVEK